VGVADTELIETVGEGIGLSVGVTLGDIVGIDEAEALGEIVLSIIFASIIAFVSLCGSKGYTVTALEEEKEKTTRKKVVNPNTIKGRAFLTTCPTNCIKQTYYSNFVV
jgi:hypothetical protein